MKTASVWRGLWTVLSIVQCSLTMTSIRVHEIYKRKEEDGECTKCRWRRCDTSKTTVNGTEKQQRKFNRSKASISMFFLQVDRFLLNREILFYWLSSAIKFVEIKKENILRARKLNEREAVDYNFAKVAKLSDFSLIFFFISFSDILLLQIVHKCLSVGFEISRFLSAFIFAQ